jgi:hypothetical protein
VRGSSLLRVRGVRWQYFTEHRACLHCIVSVKGRTITLSIEYPFQKSHEYHNYPNYPSSCSIFVWWSQGSETLDPRYILLQNIIIVTIAWAYAPFATLQSTAATMPSWTYGYSSVHVTMHSVQWSLRIFRSVMVHWAYKYSAFLFLAWGSSWTLELPPT